MKRFWPVIVACVGLASAGGCADPNQPEPTDLAGRWISAPADLAPQGWHQYHLTFTNAGRFSHEVRTYGLYTGQAPSTLTAFSRVEGRFRHDGDRLVTEPERLVWWDSFYGENSRVRVEEPYPWGGLFDDARFVVDGDRLTIHFTTYPADAPVPTIAEYVRDTQ